MLFRSLFGAALAATTTMAASLQAVTGFGTNPSQIQMYIYVPDKLATKPAVVVAVSIQTSQSPKPPPVSPPQFVTKKSKRGRQTNIC